MTALYKAIKDSDEDIVKLLLTNKKLDINLKNI